MLANRVVPSRIVRDHPAATRHPRNPVNVIDLHPEDLFDKAARGVLTEAERERPDAHLARCIACRFEREVRAELASGRDEELTTEDAILRLAREEKRRAPQR